MCDVSGASAKTPVTVNTRRASIVIVCPTAACADPKYRSAVCSDRSTVAGSISLAAPATSGVPITSAQPSSANQTSLASSNPRPLASTKGVPNADASNMRTACVTVGTSAISVGATAEALTVTTSSSKTVATRTS